MKLRPTIFLSGVSSEFASFREAVEIEVQKKDCFPLNQPSFGVDYRTIEEILRRNIGEADAVIHIVGFRFGFEPKDRPPDKPRRSYTQMEYDIARELNKPVYVFLSADATVRDATSGEPSEDAEAIQLQLAHRRALEQSNSIWYTFQNKNDLCLRIAGIALLAIAYFRVDISRIDKYAPAELIGREEETKLLDDAWLKVRRAESKRPHILTFVALGGEGKTSLVAKWLAKLAHENWPGCDSAFAWSFYSQGTRDHSAASSDLFLKEAITFFGNEDDKQFAASNAGAYEKGQQLARIVGNRRSLLVLDGVEPLQYSPTSPIRSELRDSGLVALLKGLAANSDGLCIVTTRYSIPNLKTYWQTTAPELELKRLSRDAGEHLLKTLGVRGIPNEFSKLVDDVKGHALTLNLLGTYLREAHAGDIRRRNLVKLEEADAEEQSGHAFRVLEAYEQAFKYEGETGHRALAILKLLGLFDRPMSADCLRALVELPVIAGLTEPLSVLTEAQLNLAFKRLEGARLLTVNQESSGALISLDAHPLVREYFGRQLCTQQSETWHVAHRRLYKHLCTSTQDRPQPALEDLQPLYQAIPHGCQGGLAQEALENVYIERILRGTGALGFYSWKILGLFESNLGAIAYFFERPWKHICSSIRESDQSWLLNEVFIQLRALGRLTEALEPLRAGRESYVKQENWHYASILSTNLSELELTLGKVTEAVVDAEKSVTYADRSNHGWWPAFARTTYANALHQIGREIDAEVSFREAEQIHAKTQPQYPLLYSLPGFQYCDLLLGVAKRAAWQQTLECDGKSRHSEALGAVSERATQTLKWEKEMGYAPVLDLALNYLTLGRVALYKRVLFETQVLSTTLSSELKTTIDAAVNGFRRAGTTHHLPRALLTRAWLRFITDARTGSESAQEDLDEAGEIAERGPMRLHMADIHLYRARLFFREKDYPWESPQADLKAARKLIEQCGYWRRKEELEDAERVILKKSV